MQVVTSDIDPFYFIIVIYIPNPIKAQFQMFAEGLESARWSL